MNRSKNDMRTWFNDELRQIAPKLDGSIINIGAGNDHDFQGHKYRDYFVNANIYQTLDPYVKSDYSVISEIDNNSYDVALCFWVLEHVYDFQKMIYELHRIAKSTVLIAVPTMFEYHTKHDYWRFTRSSMRRLLDPYFTIALFTEYDNRVLCQGGIFIVAKK